MLLGVDYYPEQWPSHMLEADMDRILELGCNVIRIGEFAWCRMEPVETQYDFSYFDGVIAMARKKGLQVILGTPTATPPAWLIRKHPDILSQFEDGTPRAFGGRHVSCYSSVPYREHCAQIITHLAEHYKNEPAIAAWQIDNELGHEGSDQCWCPRCRAAFHNFLKEKFNGDIQALNQTYGTVSPLTGAAGSLGLVVQPELARNQWLGMSDDGVYGVITTDDASYQTVSFTPAGEAGLEEVSVPVAAYVDDLGESFPLGTRSITSTNQVILVMPASATLSGEAAGALTNVYSTYLASFADGADEDEVIAALEEAASSLDGVVTGGSYNIAEGARQSRAMTYTVNVFLYCFIAITMAIAVANVFNTIASGLMLRGREFAVLQSVGMGRGALRRMIVLECADFAAKGLVGGIALAALVNVALFQAMSLSIATLALSMPWEHVALSVAVVVAFLAASAAYALRKTHALNLVEALRSDVM